MVFEIELAVKLHANYVEVGFNANGNPRQDKVTMGRVHSPENTNNYRLRCIMIGVLFRYTSDRTTPEF